MGFYASIWSSRLVGYLGGFIRCYALNEDMGGEMRINRDRDGTIIDLEFEGHEVLPPPSSDKYANRLHYENKQLVDVVNELLERVFELENRLAAPGKHADSSAPEPSVEYVKWG